MATNLILISANEICFSTYFKKPNGLPTLINLYNFIDVKREGFIIPLVPAALMMLSDCGVDPAHSEMRFEEDGPLAVVLHNAYASEVSYQKRVLSTSIPKSRNSFYCRSNAYEGEATATAGSFFYRDVETIYRETYKAIGENIMPFLKGNISDICEKLKELSALNNRLDELGGDTENEEYKRCEIHYDEIAKNWIEFLGLKKCF